MCICGALGRLLSMPRLPRRGRAALVVLLALPACGKPQPDATLLRPAILAGTPVAGQRPRYPEMLRMADVARGEVRLVVTTDSEGVIVPGSPRVLDATHELFAAEVRKVLPTWRFAVRRGQRSRTDTLAVQFVAVTDSLALPRCERAGHPVLTSCGARIRPREVITW